MSDDLLSYYNQELAYIRRMGAEFAEAHPKLAGRLRLSPDAVEDPHVARLIEAFSYLTARIRRKLDDDFPELTESLLSVLYPHYLAPIPSMTIAQFVCQPDLSEGYLIPAHTPLETEPIDGASCRFRTCYPTTVWPIQVKSASLQGKPLTAPKHPRSGDAVAVLRLTLQCAVEGMAFSDLGMDSVRFFLRGQPQQVFPLYELILNNCVALGLADSPTDSAPVFLNECCIRPVGFERDEGMLPYPARSSIGYRLLSEFFTFPEKFLFFELVSLKKKTANTQSSEMDVFIYLDRSFTSLEQNVTEKNFVLGCTPIVNLYKQIAEPIPLTHTRTEYRITPDARRRDSSEVYSVDKVIATSSDGTVEEYHPFYDVHHGNGGSSPGPFWHATRRSETERDSGTDVYLSVVDLGFSPSAPPSSTLTIETTCLNRDLPNRLPFGGGHPQLRLSEGSGPLSHIECLIAPTPTNRPPLRGGVRWRLISHLLLNHLSLGDEMDSGQALREILTLYDFKNSPESRAIIEGILRVKCGRVARRLPWQGLGAISHGIEVNVEFDEKNYSGSSLFLFTAVLERFFGLYCSINSFTQFIATIRGREGVFCKWPPRAGEKQIL